MKAGQLIKYLRRYPEDTDVFIPGYEGGVDAINSTTNISVKLYEHDEWYYGQHETDVPEKSDCNGILLSYDAKLFCNTIHRKYPAIGILNAEGDIFRIYHLRSDKFVVEDQHKRIMGKYTREQILDFINGKTDWTDSLGDKYHYPTCSESMKPTASKLYAFLGMKLPDELKTKFTDKCYGIAVRMKSLPYDYGDDSDLGNEVGELLSSLDPNFDIEAFITGLKHGVSLNNGTH